MYGITLRLENWKGESFRGWTGGLIKTPTRFHPSSQVGTISKRRRNLLLTGAHSERGGGTIQSLALKGGPSIVSRHLLERPRMIECLPRGEQTIPRQIQALVVRFYGALNFRGTPSSRPMLTVYHPVPNTSANTTMVPYISGQSGMCFDI